MYVSMYVSYVCIPTHPPTHPPIHPPTLRGRGARTPTRRHSPVSGHINPPHPPHTPILLPPPPRLHIPTPPPPPVANRPARTRWLRTIPPSPARPGPPRIGSAAICVCMYMYVYLSCLSIYLSIYLCICMCICMYVRIYMCVCVCVHIERPPRRQELLCLRFAEFDRLSTDLSVIHVVVGSERRRLVHEVDKAQRAVDPCQKKILTSQCSSMLHYIKSQCILDL